MGPRLVWRGNEVFDLLGRITIVASMGPRLVWRGNLVPAVPLRDAETELQWGRAWFGAETRFNADSNSGIVAWLQWGRAWFGAETLGYAPAASAGFSGFNGAAPGLARIWLNVVSVRRHLAELQWGRAWFGAETSSNRRRHTAA